MDKKILHITIVDFKLSEGQKMVTYIEDFLQWCKILQCVTYDTRMSNNIINSLKYRFKNEYKWIIDYLPYSLVFKELKQRKSTIGYELFGFFSGLCYHEESRSFHYASEKEFNEQIYDNLLKNLMYCPYKKEEFLLKLNLSNNLLERILSYIISIQTPSHLLNCIKNENLSKTIIEGIFYLIKINNTCHNLDFRYYNT